LTFIYKDAILFIDEETGTQENAVINIPTAKVALEDLIQVYGPEVLGPYQNIARGKLPRFPGSDGLLLTHWCVNLGLLEESKGVSTESRLLPGAGMKYRVPESIVKLVLEARIENKEIVFD